ncbi:hypothetical protein WA158_007507 [Blastocystis sp. Blastoise]
MFSKILGQKRKYTESVKPSKRVEITPQTNDEILISLFESEIDILSKILFKTHNSHRRTSYYKATNDSFRHFKHALLFYKEYMSLESNNDLVQQVLQMQKIIRSLDKGITHSKRAYAYCSSQISVTYFVNINSIYISSIARLYYIGNVLFKKFIDIHKTKYMKISQEKRPQDLPLELYESLNKNKIEDIPFIDNENAVNTV